MERPEKPQLIGKWHSKNNRFTWDADHIPRPSRSSTPNLQRHTEPMPVLCSWCGYPYWPPMHVSKGQCSDECKQAEQGYLKDRSERSKLLDELLEQRIEISKLQGLLGTSQVS